MTQEERELIALYKSTIFGATTESDETLGTIQFRHLLSLARAPDGGPSAFRIPDEYEAWTNSSGRWYSISRVGDSICGGPKNEVTEHDYSELLARFTDSAWLAENEMNKIEPESSEVELT